VANQGGLLPPKKNSELEKHLGRPQSQLIHMNHTSIKQEGFLLGSEFLLFFETMFEKNLGKKCVFLVWNVFFYQKLAIFCQFQKIQRQKQDFLFSYKNLQEINFK
jgi:hypothetical protein